MELSDFSIGFRSRMVVKAQALANLVVEFTFSKPVEMPTDSTKEAATRDVVSEPVEFALHNPVGHFTLTKPPPKTLFV